MKRNIFLLIAFALFSQFIFAQSVKIMPKKVVYHRKLGKGFEQDNFRKTFQVSYPILSGLKKDVIADIYKNISYWKNFKTNLQETRKNGIVLKLSYQVEYNKNSILNVILENEAEGFRSYDAIKIILIDLRTGKKIKANDQFKKTSLKKLEKFIRSKIIKDAKNWWRKDIDNSFLDKKTDFLFSNLDTVLISNKGISFWVNYGFEPIFSPIRLANNPNFDVLITWKELKPYIKKDSLFAQFVR